MKNAKIAITIIFLLWTVIVTAPIIEATTFAGAIVDLGVSHQSVGIPL
jgi:hypothetical protein